MVDMSDKLKKIMTYIDQGKYFTINRARQYGKTTTLYLIERYVKADNVPVSISFESADDLFVSQYHFAVGFIRKVECALRRCKVEEHLIENWCRPVSENFPFEDLNMRITEFCDLLDQKVVLLIDEVDKSADNQIFLSFLGLLRNKYLAASMGKESTFHSVILAGVYDIKNLKLRLRAEEEKKYNSPWNIAVEFKVDMSFSRKEIAGMLQDYAADNKLTMDFENISERIHFYTSGYPFLVSWLCKWIDEECDKKWTVANVDLAEKELLKSDNTLFDDLIKNVENNKLLNEVITGILFDGLKLPFVKSDPAINLGVVFGILSDHNSMVGISNVIFETYLYNHVIVRKIREQYAFGVESNQFIKNGQLDMDKVLCKFQEIMKAEYRHEDVKFIEQQGRLLFLCFIKPIINGKGNYYVEPETRNNTRMDIAISYGGQEYIIELKIWHGEKYRQDALIQLGEYLETRNVEKGYLISFSFNKNKTYDRNTIVLGENRHSVFEVIV